MIRFQQHVVPAHRTEQGQQRQGPHMWDRARTERHGNPTCRTDEDREAWGPYTLPSNGVQGVAFEGNPMLLNLCFSQLPHHRGLWS